MVGFFLPFGSLLRGSVSFHTPVTQSHCLTFLTSQNLVSCGQFLFLITAAAPS